MTLLVSVVIPTYNRPHLLNRCLAALAKQSFDPAAYEVIVVDDGPSLQTKDLVKQWAAQVGQKTQLIGDFIRTRERLRAGNAFSPQPVQINRYGTIATNWPGRVNGGGAVMAEYKVERNEGPPALVERGPENKLFRLRYIATKGKQGPAAARNKGWQLAEGKIIAFTDDDCIPQPDWLRAGVNAFSGAVVAVSGRVVVPVPQAPTDYQRDAKGLEAAEFVTANCFYRRSVLAGVGGFDEQYRAAWREDSDLFFTVLKWAGENAPTEKLKFAPAAVVVHPVRPAPWGVSLKQQQKSRYNALLYKKHPQLYCQRIQAHPPWFYYITVTALLAAGAGMITGHSGVALAGGALWLILTCMFCIRRLRGTAHTAAHVMEMIVTSALIPPLSVFWRLYGALKYRVRFL